MGHVGNYKKAMKAWKQSLKKQVMKTRKLLVCMRSWNMVAKRLLEVRNELLRERVRVAFENWDTPRSTVSDDEYLIALDDEKVCKIVYGA